MTNTQHLVGKLESVAELDKALWSAYRQSLVSRLPPFLNLLRVHRIHQELCGKKLLRWWQHYYAFMVGALLCGISSLFVSYWLLIGYAVLLFSSAKLRSKFVEAYAHAQIGRPNISKHSFGLQTPSLLVAGVMDALRDERIKIDSTTLESVIKLNKATHEFEDIAFGVSDAIRKGAIGAPLALALWLFSTAIPIGLYLGKVQDILLKQPLLAGILIIFLLGFAFLAYQLAFSGVVTKRDRKRYLLVLNLLRESFQERRK